MLTSPVLYRVFPSSLGAGRDSLTGTRAGSHKHDNGVKRKVRTGRRKIAKRDKNDEMMVNSLASDVCLSKSSSRNESHRRNERNDSLLSSKQRIKAEERENHNQPR